RRCPDACPRDFSRGPLSSRSASSLRGEPEWVEEARAVFCAAEDRGRFTSAAGEALDLLSRELGIPAARLTTWREAFLDAGQKALKTQPLDSRDREIGRLREKLGESTMEIELLREKLGRLETSRPLPPRRSRR